MVVASVVALRQAGVANLLKRQPLTFHVAVDPEISGCEDALLKECEDATKYTVSVGADVGEAGEDLQGLVKFARRLHPSKDDIKLDMGENTFFLSLTFPDLAPHTELLRQLTPGTDAMELRVVSACVL